MQCTQNFFVNLDNIHRILLHSIFILSLFYFITDSLNFNQRYFLFPQKKWDISYPLCLQHLIRTLWICVVVRKWSCFVLNFLLSSILLLKLTLCSSEKYFLYHFGKLQFMSPICIRIFFQDFFLPVYKRNMFSVLSLEWIYFVTFDHFWCKFDFKYIALWFMLQLF